jgi:hypothetical protein
VLLGDEASGTVVQGLPNGKHTLELQGAEGVTAVRVYRPSVLIPASQK